MDKARKPRLACVIMAAGLGTRMRSERPKALHPLFGRPLLQYALDAVSGLKPDITVVVAGKEMEGSEKLLTVPANTRFVTQRDRKGTAHALLTALKDGLKGFGDGTVLALNGDTPLLEPATLRKLLRLHRRDGNSLSLISFRTDEPASYGRVIRGRGNEPVRIVENPDATASQKTINEVNSGVYAFEAPALSLLPKIKMNTKKKEYYLTDIVEVASRKGLRAGVYRIGDEEEMMGVNTRHELAVAHEVLRGRVIDKWISKGVSIIDAFSVYIEPTVSIGGDTVIYPNVYLQGRTRVGKGCTIYPNVRVVDSVISNGAVIKDSTVVEESTVGPNASVGPFAHLRPGTRVGASAKIGNFVEVKKSGIGKGSKAMHLAYIGDAELGSNVNVGAGTITCNYDGRRKHKTVIGDDVFIGSDTQLVAPVSVGKGSYIAAGTTVTKKVPPGHLAISRTKQRNIEHKVTKRKK